MLCTLYGTSNTMTVMITVNSYYTITRVLWYSITGPKREDIGVKGRRAGFSVGSRDAGG